MESSWDYISLESTYKELKQNFLCIFQLAIWVSLESTYKELKPLHGYGRDTADFV